MNYNTATVSRENMSMSSIASKHGKKRNGRRPSQEHNPQQNTNNNQQLQGAWKINKRQKFNGGTNHNNKNVPIASYASACKVGVDGTNSKKRVMQQQAAAEPMDLEPMFPKLNQSDAGHARRIQQRRKTVAMGKNTLGYAAYLEQVPKHKRRIRSMDMPGTPDHTLDIPTRRWQGMIKAWRKALHQYDPPDLVNTSVASADGDASNKATAAKSNNKDSTTQSREIESAIANGLLVDVSTPSPKKASRMSDNHDNGMGESPFSVLSESSPARNMLEDVQAEAAGTASLRWGDDDSDSDDDLL